MGMVQRGTLSIVAIHLSPRYRRSNESVSGHCLEMDGVNLVCSTKYPVHIFSRNAEYFSCLPTVIRNFPPGGSTIGPNNASSTPGRLYAEGIMKRVPSDVSNSHPVTDIDSDFDRLVRVTRSLNGFVFLPLKIEISISL